MTLKTGRIHTRRRLPLASGRHFDAAKHPAVRLGDSREILFAVERREAHAESVDGEVPLVRRGEIPVERHESSGVERREREFEKDSSPQSILKQHEKLSGGIGG